MKKILITVLQIAVTVGMLIWVFHDPNQRGKMAEALRTVVKEGPAINPPVRPTIR